MSGRVVLRVASDDIDRRVAAAVRTLSMRLERPADDDELEAVLAPPIDRTTSPDADVEPIVLVVDADGSSWMAEVARLVAQRPNLQPFVVADIGGEQLLAALSAGVVGVCPRDASPAAIARSIRDVISCGASIPRDLVPPLVNEVRRAHGHLVETADGWVQLTDREWQVMHLLIQGRTTAEMAGAMFVSRGTVRSHVSALLHKLGAVDRAEAVAIAQTATS